MFSYDSITRELSPKTVPHRLKPVERSLIYMCLSLIEGQVSERIGGLLLPANCHPNCHPKTHGGCRINSEAFQLALCWLMALCVSNNKQSAHILHITEAKSHFALESCEAVLSQEEYSNVVGCHFCDCTCCACEFNRNVNLFE